jgi:hypothetical protein
MPRSPLLSCALSGALLLLAPRAASGSEPDPDACPGVCIGIGNAFDAEWCAYDFHDGPREKAGTFGCDSYHAEARDCIWECRYPPSAPPEPSTPPAPPSAPPADVGAIVGGVVGGILLLCMCGLVYKTWDDCRWDLKYKKCVEPTVERVRDCIRKDMHWKALGVIVLIVLWPFRQAIQLWESCKAQPEPAPAPVKVEDPPTVTEEAPIVIDGVTLAPTAIELDTDGDGVTDQMAIDYDGDGKADVVYQMGQVEGVQLQEP